MKTLEQIPINLELEVELSRKLKDAYNKSYHQRTGVPEKFYNMLGAFYLHEEKNKEVKK
jgi:hypothetical protein